MAEKLGVLLRAARQDEDAIRQESLVGESWADLDGSVQDFMDCTFENCRFENCDFTRASFCRCRLTGCLFVGCHFEESYWKESTLTDTRADGCNFREGVWKDTLLTGCSLRYANFSDAKWERVQVKDTAMREAFLTEIKLLKPSFAGVDFGGADFFHTRLRGVDLTQCEIGGIALSDNCAELKGARIRADQAIEPARILGIKVV